MVEVPEVPYWSGLSKVLWFVFRYYLCGLAAVAVYQWFYPDWDPDRLYCTEQNFICAVSNRMAVLVPWPVFALRGTYYFLFFCLPRRAAGLGRLHPSTWFFTSPKKTAFLPAFNRGDAVERKTPAPGESKMRLFKIASDGTFLDGAQEHLSFCYFAWGWNQEGDPNALFHLYEDEIKLVDNPP